MLRVFFQARCLHSSPCLMKTPKGKSAAEHRWLQRQLRDPYVKASRTENFRCRSAYKLLQIDDKFRILKPGHSVVDCGAAPGAWSQVAVQKVNSARTDPDFPYGTVIGVDLLNIPPLEGALFLSCHDVTDPSTHARLQELLPKGRAHVILSDMAPNASGFREMDHERLVTMCLSLLDLSKKVLRPGGSLLCKYWDGGLARKLQDELSSVFGSVRTVKPDASRKDSAERCLAGVEKEELALDGASHLAGSDCHSPGRRLWYQETDFKKGAFSEMPSKSKGDSSFESLSSKMQIVVA